MQSDSDTTLKLISRPMRQGDLALERLGGLGRTRGTGRRGRLIREYTGGETAVYAHRRADDGVRQVAAVGEAGGMGWACAP
jgi:hypothetical protein